MMHKYHNMQFLMFYNSPLDVSSIALWNFIKLNISFSRQDIHNTHVIRENCQTLFKSRSSSGPLNRQLSRLYTISFPLLNFYTELDCQICKKSQDIFKFIILKSERSKETFDTITTNIFTEYFLMYCPQNIMSLYCLERTVI